jgi:hypothetical protein
VSASTPDPLAAYLNNLGKRNRAFGEGAEEIPRLVAALEKVLEQHQPGRVLITGALCPRHENHRYFSITGSEAASVRDCPDCAAAVWVSCAGCAPQIPVDSCPARTAISAALLGGGEDLMVTTLNCPGLLDPHPGVAF